MPVGSAAVNFRADAGISANRFGLATASTMNAWHIATSDPFEPGLLRSATWNGTHWSEQVTQVGADLEFLAGAQVGEWLVVVFRVGLDTAMVATATSDGAWHVVEVERAPVPGAYISDPSVAPLAEGLAAVAIGWSIPGAGTGYHLHALTIPELEVVARTDVPSLSSPFGMLAPCAEGVCLAWTASPFQVDLARFDANLNLLSRSVAWQSPMQDLKASVLDVVLVQADDGTLMTALALFDPAVIWGPLSGPNVLLSVSGGPWLETGLGTVDRLMAVPIAGGIALVFSGDQGYEVAAIQRDGRVTRTLHGPDAVFLGRARDEVALLHLDRMDPPALVVEGLLKTASV